MASDDSKFCHLCGSSGPMSFEHIPPARCWNDQPTRLIEMAGLSDRYPAPPERRYNRGLGRKSLCRRCNGWTASQYSDAFFRWSVQAAAYADTVDEPVAEGLLFSIEPLRVIKQLLTMAIAAADPANTALMVAVRRFVLNAHEVHLPLGIAIHAYLNPKSPKSRAFRDSDQKHLLPLNRMTKTCLAMDITGKPMLAVFAEIAMPPMGYLFRWTESGVATPHQVASMPDLSFFGKFRLNEQRRIFLNLPVRTPVGPTVGRYLGEENK